MARKYYFHYMRDPDYIRGRDVGTPYEASRAKVGTLAAELNSLYREVQKFADAPLVRVFAGWTAVSDGFLATGSEWTHPAVLISFESGIDWRAQFPYEPEVYIFSAGYFDTPRHNLRALRLALRAYRLNTKNHVFLRKSEPEPGTYWASSGDAKGGTGAGEKGQYKAWEQAWEQARRENASGQERAREDNTDWREWYKFWNRTRDTRDQQEQQGRPQDQQSRTTNSDPDQEALQHAVWLSMLFNNPRAVKLPVTDAWRPIPAVEEIVRNLKVWAKRAVRIVHPDAGTALHTAHNWTRLRKILDFVERQEKTAGAKAS